MGFISSSTNARRHGVYAIERQPPPQIAATGTGVTCQVGQFPWGPDGVVYAPTSPKDFFATFCPAGMSRVATGVLQAISCSWPSQRIVRVVASGGAGGASAHVHLDGTGEDITVTAKSIGTWANSNVTATVSAATDSNANHFKLVVAGTAPSGSVVSETYDNLNYHATPYSTPDVTSSQLIASITVVVAGRPENAAYALASGVNATTGASKATCELLASSSHYVTMTAKYKGTAGNSIVSTVAAATDGDADHCKVTVHVTDGYNTTTEVFDNLDFTGTFPTIDCTSSVLVGSFAAGANAPGRPTNGDYNFASAEDGTIILGDYVGTPGLGDKGIAAAEADNTIRHIFTDDCGNSLRPAVNLALQAHATLMGDRIDYYTANSGSSQAVLWAAVATVGPNVRSVPVDGWVYVTDFLGTQHLIPGCGFAASVAAQSPPSRSIAWKNAIVQAMMASIVGLEYFRGTGTADNTDRGIVTIIREETGGYTFEAGVVSLGISEPAKRNLTRTRMGDYVSLSFQTSMRPVVDAPMVSQIEDQIVGSLQEFMDLLKKNRDTDPINLPFVEAYEILPLSSMNDTTTQAAGQLFIPLTMKVGASIEKMFLSMQFGENVKPTVAWA